MARPLVYDVRILLTLERRISDELDKVLRPDEQRASFIRAAIEREILRRRDRAEKPKC